MEEIKVGDRFTIPNSKQPQEVHTCTEVKVFDKKHPEFDGIAYTDHRGDTQSVERKCCFKTLNTEQ